MKSGYDINNFFSHTKYKKKIMRDSCLDSQGRHNFIQIKMLFPTIQD